MYKFGWAIDVDDYIKYVQRQVEIDGLKHCSARRGGLLEIEDREDFKDHSTCCVQDSSRSGIFDHQETLSEWKRHGLYVKMALKCNDFASLYTSYSSDLRLLQSLIKL